jgi:hypothetical protein
MALDDTAEKITNKNFLYTSFTTVLPPRV